MKAPEVNELQVQRDRELVKDLLRNDERAFHRFVEEYFTEERCQACHHLLLDTAHLLQVSDQESSAATVRAAAGLFEQPTAKILAHPLPRRFIERVLGGAHQHTGPGDEEDAGGEERGLIITDKER